MTAETVLLAEPDSIFGDVVDAYFASRGYRVLRVRDGRRAVEALMTDPCQAVVTGLELEGVDGLELAATAGLLPTPPPVILTTCDPGLVQTLLAPVGILEVVVRPCRIGALVQALERATGRRAPRPTITGPAVLR